jgi:hypothetical protein
MFLQSSIEGYAIGKIWKNKVTEATRRKPSRTTPGVRNIGIPEITNAAHLSGPTPSAIQSAIKKLPSTVLIRFAEMERHIDLPLQPTSVLAYKPHRRARRACLSAVGIAVPGRRFRLAGAIRWRYSIATASRARGRSSGPCPCVACRRAPARPGARKSVRVGLSLSGSRPLSRIT